MRADQLGLEHVPDGAILVRRSREPGGPDGYGLSAVIYPPDPTWRWRVMRGRWPLTMTDTIAEGEEKTLHDAKYATRRAMPHLLLWEPADRNLPTWMPVDGGE